MKNKTKYRKCRSCGELKAPSEFFKTCSSYCKQCKMNMNKEGRRTAKEQSVEYKGGECQICGYNKCINALEFHHVDPAEKDHITFNKRWSFEKLKSELDKCVLLCANCHREIHAGEVELFEGNIK